MLTHDWNDFYPIYDNTLRAMARRFCSQREDRQDLVQEVWLKVLIHVPTLDWPASRPRLRGWLCQLIRRQMLNLLRHHARHPNELAGSLEGHEVIDPAPDRADRLEYCWDCEFLNVMLARLKKNPSPVNRRLLTMRWIEARSIPEIAQALHLTERQITYRQRYFLARLRKAWAWYRGEPLPETPPGPSSGPTGKN